MNVYRSIFLLCYSGMSQWEKDTFTEIGKNLERDRTTIAKEVKIMLLSSAQDTVHILIMFVNIGKRARERMAEAQIL